MTVRTAFNMACPKCGSDGYLQVTIETWAELSHGRTKPVGQHIWDQYSACRCTCCDFESAVEQFRQLPETERPKLKAFEIRFTEEDTFSTIVEAADEATARAIAETLLAENGPNTPFEVTHNVRSDINVEEVRS